MNNIDKKIQEILDRAYWAGSYDGEEAGETNIVLDLSEELKQALLEAILEVSPKKYKTIQREDYVDFIENKNRDAGETIRQLGFNMALDEYTKRIEGLLK